MILSIITVVKNGEKQIGQTLDSIVLQNQTNCKLESIICDGGSTDNTLNIATKYKEKYMFISVYSQSDAGIYDAMNKAIKHAHGDYVIFLNAGDTFFSQNTVDEIINNIVQKKYPNIIYGNTAVMKNNGTQKIIKKRFGIHSLIMANMICHQSIIAQRELFDEYQFDTSFKFCADRDWLYYMYFKKYRICYMNQVICNYDNSGVSSSDENKTHLLTERYNIQSRYCPYFLVINKFIQKITGGLGRLFTLNSKGVHS
ncbi:glycosyltransferase family 2 protein [Butyrivibrio sp. VCD2006]|uniref:glycosyltransferase family 2 protein n=1 Tax=Butyrivibrio sp. VCD2006 TaxID=1280664 RepID=UPI0004059A26|nr:glycosyltransferase family 2 protein [Butyrivibrio sp. VCD2006]